MGDWEEIFKKEGYIFVHPQEGINKVLRLFKKESVKRVLDLGCGTGRHTILLAKKGFEVYSTDVSKAALKLAKKWLNNESLKAKIKQASCYEKFPFKNNFFDAVISTQVINHNFHEQIKYCVSEIERVLKPQGLIFITVAGRKNNKRSKKSKLIGPRTYAPLDGPEKGLPHFTYNKKILLDDFKNFEVINTRKSPTTHYELLARLK